MLKVLVGILKSKAPSRSRLSLVKILMQELETIEEKVKKISTSSKS